MSWRFPKHVTLSGQTVTPDDLNEAIRPAAEELSGQLNEHNWAVGTIPNPWNCASDCAFVWNSVGFSLPVLTLQSSFVWQEIVGLTIEEPMPSCILWIHVSLMLTPLWPGGAGDQPPVAIAISVDGQLVQESIVGGGELGNDEEQLSGARVALGTSICLPVSSGDHRVSVYFRAADKDSETEIHFRELIILQMRK